MQTRTPAAVVLVGVVLASALGACRSSGFSLSEDPERALEQVERRLLEAHSVRCFSELTAEGAFAADLKSEHQLAPDGRVRVRVRGSLAGRAVDAVFEREGEPELVADLIADFTRLGWMHDARRLAGGGLPEAAADDVSGRVEARNVRFGDEFELNGVPARPLLFDVAIAGQVSAQVVLWVALDTGLPLIRLQREATQQGELRVIEFYEQLELNGLMPVIRS